MFCLFFYCIALTPVELGYVELHRRVCSHDIPSALSSPPCLSGYWSGCGIIKTLLGKDTKLLDEYASWT